MIMRSIKQLTVILVGIGFLASGAITKAEAKEEAQKSINDKTVNFLMKTAFTLMPEVYTGPDGKKITFDKKKPKEILIPLDDARRIIRVGYRSAQAQKCDLKVMQTLNHNAMVKYESVFKNWSDKQKLYILRLHLFTIQFMTGSNLVEDIATVQKRVENNKDNLKALIPKDLKKLTCPEKDRKKVVAEIDTYITQVKQAISKELQRRSKLGGNQKKNDPIKKAEK